MRVGREGVYLWTASTHTTYTILEADRPRFKLLLLAIPTVSPNFSTCPSPATVLTIHITKQPLNECQMTVKYSFSGQILF